MQELTKSLADGGVSVDGLQERPAEQFEQDRVMAGFTNLSTRVLVATDVAGRGIVEALDAVINFDIPFRLEPLCASHRAHPGRARAHGLQHLLVTPRSEGGG